MNYIATTRFVPKGLPWTPERVELLTALWRDGQSTRRIAEQLGGTTRDAVLGKAHRLKLAPHPKQVELSTSKRLRLRSRRQRNSATTDANSLALRRARTAGKGDAPHEFGTSGDLRVLRGAVWEPLAGLEPISIMELPGRASERCRWPVTGGYCGAESGERVYCEVHAALAFKPSSYPVSPQITAEKNKMA